MISHDLQRSRAGVCSLTDGKIFNFWKHVQFKISSYTLTLRCVCGGGGVCLYCKCLAPVSVLFRTHTYAHTRPISGLRARPIWPPPSPWPPCQSLERWRLHRVCVFASVDVWLRANTPMVKHASHFLLTFFFSLSVCLARPAPPLSTPPPPLCLPLESTTCGLLMKSNP